MTSAAEGQSANAVMLDRAIRSAIMTERFKNHEARRILRILDREVLPDLRSRLAQRLENIATRGFDTGPTTAARLQFLYRDLRALFDDLAARLRTETEDQLVSFAEAQASSLVREMRAEVGTLASVAAPSTGALRSAILTRPLSGVLLKERWAGRARRMRQAVEAQIRMGLVQSETPAQIISRVRAVWPGERRHVASTVGASVRHAQNQARQATYEENADLIAGVIWTATLDVSTCPRCALLDGTVLPVDEGPRPPLHEGPCRCSTAPVLKSARALGGTRASMDGQVPDATTFEEWIGRQSAERQDEVFGKGRATLFRAGRLELRDMVDAAGNVISLEQLTAGT